MGARCKAIVLAVDEQQIKDLFIDYSSVIDSHHRLVNATFPFKGRLSVNQASGYKFSFVRTDYFRTVEDAGPYSF